MKAVKNFRDLEKLSVVKGNLICVPYEIFNAKKMEHEMIDLEGVFLGLGAKRFSITMACEDEQDAIVLGEIYAELNGDYPLKKGLQGNMLSLSNRDPRKKEYRNLIKRAGLTR